MGHWDELTPKLYLTYKRRGLTDEEIGNMFDVSHNVISYWKNKHGLKGVDVRSWETWKTYFPEDVKKQVDRFKELYDKGWKHSAIAEDMQMSRCSLTRLKEENFPELVRKWEFRFTAEQLKVMKENKIPIHTAHARVKTGMNPDDAVRIPAVRTGWKGDPSKRRIGQKSAAEVEPKHTVVIEDIFTPEQIRRAAKKGITRAMLRWRMWAGWEKKRALTQLPQIRGKKK